MTELRMMQKASARGREAFPEQMETIGSGDITFDMDVNAEPATLFSDGYFHCLKDLVPSVERLIDCVERYVKQECLRSELLNSKEELKKLL